MLVDKEQMVLRKRHRERSGPSHACCFLDFHEGEQDARRPRACRTARRLSPNGGHGRCCSHGGRLGVTPSDAIDRCSRGEPRTPSSRVSLAPRWMRGRRSAARSASAPSMNSRRSPSAETTGATVRASSYRFARSALHVSSRPTLPRALHRLPFRVAPPVARVLRLDPAAPGRPVAAASVLRDESQRQARPGGDRLDLLLVETGSKNRSRGSELPEGHGGDIVLGQPSERRSRRQSASCEVPRAHACYVGGRAIQAGGESGGDARSDGRGLLPMSRQAPSAIVSSAARCWCPCVARLAGA